VSHGYKPLAAVLMLALALTVTGCSDDSTEKAAEPVGSTGVPEIPMTELIASAEKANAGTDNTVSKSGARPLTTAQGENGGQPKFSDMGTENWPPNTYKLVVACAGTGTLDVRFKLGSTEQSKKLKACRPAATSDSIEVKLAKQAKGSAIAITPEGNARAAVAYQIRRAS
jgi:hypothetical protein